MTTAPTPFAAVDDVPVEPEDVTTATAVACKTCGQVHVTVVLHRGQVAKCIRCGSTLHRRTRLGLAGTAAFSLCAILFYVPANAFPILDMELYGTDSETTVWGGVLLFYRDRQYAMAVVVLLASMVIPAVKLLILLFLTVTTALNWRRGEMLRTRLFQFVEAIGRWAMLDVFALSIWVATVKLDRLASVHPGAGLFPFGCVVLFTMFATACFDPQSIWDHDKGTAS